MPTLAQELTGSSAAELYQSHLPSVTATSDIWYPEGKDVRGSVRVRAQIIVGPDELDVDRQIVVHYEPQAIK